MATPTPPAMPPPQAQNGNANAPPLQALPAQAIPISPRVQDAINSFQGFITFVFSIAIFGASVFAIIASTMADPKDIWSPDPPPFTLQTVRNLLAVSWLCFILAIAIAGYSSGYLTIHRERAKGNYDQLWTTRWERVGVACSVALHFLMVGAFMCMSLALVPYAREVGWVAFGCTAIAGLVVLGLSIYQVGHAF